MEKRGITLWRIDYGYPRVMPPGGERWDLLDLEFAPLSSARKEDPFPRRAGRDPERCLLVRNADRLLAWERLKGGRNPFPGLVRLGGSIRVWLQCRFPKHASAILAGLRAVGGTPAYSETPMDGALPPLYRDLNPSDPRLRLHLDLEWATALAAARGGIVVEHLGRELAQGPRSAKSLAATLGVTQGAVRSYLAWMADVALVRRDGSDFLLAHPLLALRFLEPTAPTSEGFRTLRRPPSFDVSLD